MPEPKCRIITDSNCDLDQDMLRKAGVTVLQMPFLINEEEYYDDGWKTMPENDFYWKLRAGESMYTAQSPIPGLQKLFNEVLDDGIPAVFFSFTSGLSGTFETRDHLAKEMVAGRGEGAELYVVDTLLASIAEGLLVLKAIEKRDEGLTAKELAKWAESARFFVHAAAFVDDIEYLRRGGRIPDMAAGVAAKLDIKPIINMNNEGKLAFVRIAKGKKKAIKTIIKTYKNDREPFEGKLGPVTVATTNSPVDAAEIEELVHKIDPDVEIVHSEVGPVIGTHLGPGSGIICFWGNDRRKGRKDKKDKDGEGADAPADADTE